MINISEKIKSLRITNQISQASLADDLGVSRSCLSDWERNIRKPKTKHIYKYIELFNLPSDYFSDSDEKTKDKTESSEMDYQKLQFIYNNLVSSKETDKKKGFNK